MANPGGWLEVDSETEYVAAEDTSAERAVQTPLANVAFQGGDEEEKWRLATNNLEAMISSISGSHSQGRKTPLTRVKKKNRNSTPTSDVLCPMLESVPSFREKRFLKNQNPQRLPTQQNELLDFGVDKVDFLQQEKLSNKYNNKGSSAPFYNKPVAGTSSCTSVPFGDLQISSSQPPPRRRNRRGGASAPNSRKSVSQADGEFRSPVIPPQPSRQVVEKVTSPLLSKSYSQTQGSDHEMGSEDSQNRGKSSPHSITFQRFGSDHEIVFEESSVPQTKSESQLSDKKTYHRIGSEDDHNGGQSRTFQRVGSDHEIGFEDSPLMFNSKHKSDLNSQQSSDLEMGSEMSHPRNHSLTYQRVGSDHEIGCEDSPIMLFPKKVKSSTSLHRVRSDNELTSPLTRTSGTFQRVGSDHFQNSSMLSLQGSNKNGTSQTFNKIASDNDISLRDTLSLRGSMKKEKSSFQGVKSDNGIRLQDSPILLSTHGSTNNDKRKSDRHSRKSGSYQSLTFQQLASDFSGTPFAGSFASEPKRKRRSKKASKTTIGASSEQDSDFQRLSPQTLMSGHAHDDMSAEDDLLGTTRSNIKTGDDLGLGSTHSPICNPLMPSIDTSRSVTSRGVCDRPQLSHLSTPLLTTTVEYHNKLNSRDSDYDLIEEEELPVDRIQSNKPNQWYEIDSELEYEEPTQPEPVIQQTELPIRLGGNVIAHSFYNCDTSSETNEWSSSSHSSKVYDDDDDSTDAVRTSNQDDWPRWRIAIRKFYLSRPWIDQIFLVVIILNCVLLALSDPTKTSSARSQIIDIGDSCCTAVYVFEMIFKITCFGLKQYLTVGWNIVDGIVAITGALSLINYLGRNGVLGAFKLVRPIKIASAIPQMGVLISSLNRALPLLFNVVVLYLFFLIAMGVVGVQQWEGLLSFRCVPDGLALLGNVTEDMLEEDFSDIVCRNLSDFTSLGGYYCPWGYSCISVADPDDGWLSFNNIFYAMLVLFTSITLEGWTQAMYHTVNATTPFAVCYWLFLILFGTYFLMNLTLLIITEMFSTDVSTKKLRATKREKRNTLLVAIRNSRVGKFLEPAFVWVYNLLVFIGECTRPEDKREVVRKFINTRLFKYTTMTAILVNTVALSVQYHGQPQKMTTVIDNMNIVLLVFFIVEVLVKMYPGLRGFGVDVFNVLDLLIVVAGIVELAIGGSGAISALRSLRVLRVLKLASFPTLQRILTMIFSSISQVGYLICLLFLVMSLCSLWGMELFGGEYKEHRSNFDSFHKGVVTSFQIITGEDWNEVMHHAMTSVGGWAAIFFMMLFVVGNYLVLNLFVAVLLHHNHEEAKLARNVPHVKFSDLTTSVKSQLHRIKKGQLVNLLLRHGISRKIISGLLQFNERCLHDGCAFASLHEETDLVEAISEPHWRARVLRTSNLLRHSIKLFINPVDHISFVLGELSAFYSTLDVKVVLEDPMLALKQPLPTLPDVSSEDSDRLSVGGVSVCTEYTEATEVKDVSEIVCSCSDDPRLLESRLTMKYSSEPDMTLKRGNNKKRLQLIRSFKNWISCETIARDDRKMVEIRLLDLCRHYNLHDKQWTKADIHSLLISYTDAPKKLPDALNKIIHVPAAELIFLYDWGQQLVSSNSEKTLREMYADRVRIGEKRKPNTMLDQAWHSIQDFSSYYARKEPTKKPSCFRRGLVLVVEHPVFEFAVLAAICISTVSLAIDTPLRPDDHPVEILLAKVNFVITLVFISEVVLKSVAYGFVSTPGSYLRREVWNRLDFFIVFVSVLSLVVPNASHISSFKLLRTLRPLRFINRIRGVRIVATAMILSFPPLVQIAVISVVIWLVFAILGLQLFGGRLYRCTSVSYGDVSQEIYNTRDICLSHNYSWVNSDTNFDNVGNSFIALFQVATLEGWVSLMYRSIDSVSYEHAPIKDNNPWVAYYYIGFIIFGSFLILNLFIGVLIETYASEKERIGASLFLSQEQEKWVRVHMEMLQMVKEGIGKDPPAEYPPWRKRLFLVVVTRKFDLVIAVCIAINILGMACEHHPSTPEFDLMLSTLNLAMLCVFATEAVVKITALGIRQYLRNSWCRFDLAIVVISVLPLVIQFFIDLSGSHTEAEANILTQFRALRLIRILRMMRASRGIRRLLKTFLLSLPSLLNVAGVLFLLFFVYAVLGVWLFSKATWLPEGLDRNANFTHFAPALLLLLRMSTGESWQHVMHNCMASPTSSTSTVQGCDEHLGGCIERWHAPVYFCSFSFLGMYVLSNLFIAVILDHFGGESDSLNEGHRSLIRTCWSKHALTSTTMPASSIPQFITGIGPPLGLHQNPINLNDFITSLELRVIDDVIHRTELYSKLFRSVFGTPLPLKHEKSMEKQQENLLTGVSVDRMKPLADTIRLIKIQSLVRGMLARRRFRQQSKTNDWIELICEETSAPYFHNISTGETVWERPCDTRPSQPQLAEKWVQFTTDEGVPYFYDAANYNTSWDPPLFYSSEV